MNNRDRGGRWTAGVIGALLGAVAGASLVFFSDPDNRDKVKDKVKSIEDDAQTKLSDFKETISKASVTSKKKMAGNLRKFADQLEA